ncbi:MAG: hypothetical protein K2N52_05655, partial [Clostridia bacterium]|nr:hypothetical protein [Clostridia bacterium]
MKIIVRLSFLVLIPIIVGLALALSGYSAGAWILAIGTPAVMIALVIAGIIMLMKGKLFKKEQDEQTEEKSGADELTEREKEQAAINKVNNSRFYKSKFALAEYEANQILEATKQTSKKGFAMGIIFFILLVADAITATVLLINHIWIGAIVCAALFGVTIIAILITVVIRQAMSMHGDIRKAKRIVGGKVKSCVMSSMVTSKAAVNSVRINSVVYRVVLIADGGEYVAFSRRFYETEEE